MKAIAERIDRYWMAPAPAERLASIRVFVGAFVVVYLSIRALHLVRYASYPVSRFDPVGVVSILHSPLPSWLVVALVVATWISAVAFLVGFQFRIFGPLCALLTLWVISYRNSWGMVFHTENLMVLHLLVLGFSRSADTMSFAAPTERDPRSYGWPIRLMCSITVIAYVIAGVAKIKNAGVGWADGEVLLVQVAYDNLRKIALGDIYSPIGAFLVGFPVIFGPLAFGSLVLELFAPVALFSKKLARIWCLGAWAFHFGVLALMAINFPYQLFGPAFASFFELEKLRPFAYLRSRLSSRDGAG